jgi:3-oxoacyl-[acyl-carrier protein] reductase
VFAGKGALVTGGGRGLGFAIARTLAQQGAHVVINDIDAQQLETAVNALREQDLTADGFVADIGRADRVEAMVAYAVETCGGLDVMVNNAGVLVIKDLVDHTDEDWDRVMNTNLRGVFLCCRAGMRHMIPRKRGAIVNIASMAGHHYTVNHVAYAVAKAGVVALTRDAGVEGAKHGVRVNGVSPGPIATPMSDTVDKSLHDALGQASQVGDNGWGDPQDIADAVAFLASDRARFVVGETLMVAGGANLRVLAG